MARTIARVTETSRRNSNECARARSIAFYAPRATPQHSNKSLLFHEIAAHKSCINLLTIRIRTMKKATHRSTRVARCLAIESGDRRSAAASSGRHRAVIATRAMKRVSASYTQGLQWIYAISCVSLCVYVLNQMLCYSHEQRRQSKLSQARSPTLKRRSPEAPRTHKDDGSTSSSPRHTGHISDDETWHSPEGGQ